ncbi:HAMP domain-containing protein [bacterium]|nr:HAMP domain-containing protein [bacterium]
MEVALFLNQISKSFERGEQAVSFSRDINFLERKFLEIRLLETTSLAPKNTEIHKNYEVVLTQLKQGIDELEVEPFTADITAKKPLLSALLSQYDSTFNRLIQLKVEHRLNATSFMSNYQVLNSGIIMSNKSNLLRALFSLNRFQEEYLESHRETSYRALKMVHSMFKGKYVQSSIDNERLESSINTYDQLLDVDYSLDKEITMLRADFGRISLQLITTLSNLSQKAEALSKTEIENVISTRTTLLRVFFFSMAIGVMLFICVVAVISRRIITPLRQMSNLIGEVKSGVVNARFTSQDKGEIVNLGLAFNEMLDIIDKSNKQWKAQYKNFPIPIYSWRRTENDFELVDYNDAAFESTEGQIVNFIGKKFSEIQADDPELMDYITKSYLEKTVVKKEMSYRFKSIAKRRVLNATCVYIPPDMVAVHTEDITALKKMQDQLIRSERLAATGQLAASIAHEINSPLLATAFMLNSIKEEYKQNKELVESIDLLKETFNSIRDTVKNLLDLNRPAQAEKQPIRINDTIEKTVMLFQNQLKKNNIKVNLELSSRVPQINASPQLLSQVFLNLINNSIEAMSGKLIDQKQSPTIVREITIKNNLRKGFIVTRFSDSGPGIPEDDMDKIFDPFYTKKKPMGLGVGLSICHNIVKDHGGSMTATNSPVGGALFIIKLPVDQAVVNKMEGSNGKK